MVEVSTTDSGATVAISKVQPPSTDRGSESTCHVALPATGGAVVGEPRVVEAGPDRRELAKSTVLQAADYRGAAGIGQVEAAPADAATQGRGIVGDATTHHRGHTCCSVVCASGYGCVCRRNYCVDPLLNHSLRFQSPLESLESVGTAALKERSAGRDGVFRASVAAGARRADDQKHPDCGPQHLGQPCEVPRALSHYDIVRWSRTGLHQMLP
mmetsp:Transcript_28340/g.80007  ORF Transcript_28340/g.80007 Transcript_28340/m.80007 type:complete len:213 (-) Transcript_28340:20-658(-)